MLPHGVGFSVQGLRVWGFRVNGVVQRLGFRVSGAGFRVQGLGPGFRVQSLGLGYLI